MKFGDFKAPLLEFLYDAEYSESQLTANNTQFTRRAFIRSTFAYIEGSVWLLKQVLINNTSVDGRKILFEPEIHALLLDQTYDLTDNGETNIRQKNLYLPSNLKFEIKRFNKLFKSKVDLGINSSDWSNFLKALKVRNRITHPPKNINDFIVSDSELENSKKVSEWFTQVIHEAIKIMVPNKEKQKE